VANYCAFFCPEVKTFLNSALHADAQVVGDFLTLRREMITRSVDPKSRGVYQSGPAPAADRWPDLLRRHDIGFVVLHVGKRQLAEVAFADFVNFTTEWSLAYLQGDVAVFAWRDPQGSQESNALAALNLDFEHMAFNPTKEAKAPAQKSPQAYPGEPGWWEPFLRPAVPAANLKRDQAAMFLRYFEAKFPEYRQKHYNTWANGLAAATVADQATPLNWPGILIGPALRLDALTVLASDKDSQATPTANAMAHLQLFFLSQDAGPVAPLLIALRDARQAINADPHDPLAYLALGEAYYGLYFLTRERLWHNDLPSFGQLRTYQMLAAYKEAVRRKPDLAAAHKRLIQLYGPDNLNMPDLALEHMKAYLDLSLTAGPPPQPVARAVFEAEMESLPRQIASVERYLSDAAKEYATVTAKMVTLDRVAKAEELRMAHKALQILLGTDFSLLGEMGTRLELKLLLLTGQASKVESWTAPILNVLPDVIGAMEHSITQAQVAATLGNYQLADEYLQKMLVKNVDLVGFGQKPLPPSQVVATLAGMALAQELAPHWWPLPPFNREELDLIAQNPFGTSFKSTRLLSQTLPRLLDMQRNSSIETLRGVLALERGETAEAEARFRAALDFVGAGSTLQPGIDFPGRKIAAGYLQLLKGERP
jgi:hypothetical protein